MTVYKILLFSQDKNLQKVFITSPPVVTKQKFPLSKAFSIWQPFEAMMGTPNMMGFNQQAQMGGFNQQTQMGGFNPQAQQMGFQQMNSQFNPQMQQMTQQMGNINFNNQNKNNNLGNLLWCKA